jgi:hypothetical protein
VIDGFSRQHHKVYRTVIVERRLNGLPRCSARGALAVGPGSWFEGSKSVASAGTVGSGSGQVGGLQLRSLGGVEGCMGIDPNATKEDQRHAQHIHHMGDATGK